MENTRALANLAEINAIKKTKYCKYLEPVFKECKKAIVFESSSFFVPYQSVVLYSLLDHIKADSYYDIVILTSEIDDYDCSLLTEATKGKQNVSVRFYDPSHHVKSYIAKNPFTYLEINYYRLALPWIFGKYDVVLNLGADIVVQRDLEELLNVEFRSDEYLAGALDLGYLGRLTMDISPQELGLKHPEGYVNADVLVFNNNAIRRDFSLDDVMAVWEKYRLRCAEQDAFNMIFDGHIHHLDLRWNLYPDKMASVEHVAHNTDEKIGLWKEALQNPYIIHYAAYPKPWDYPQVGLGDKWWHYARMSPYYEEILRRLAVVSVRSELGMGRSWIQKMGDRFVYIIPRGSKMREFLKRLYATFFTAPNKEWGQKFGKEGNQ